MVPLSEVATIQRGSRRASCFVSTWAETPATFRDLASRSRSPASVWFDTDVNVARLDEKPVATKTLTTVARARWPCTVARFRSISRTSPEAADCLAVITPSSVIVSSTPRIESSGAW